MKNMQELLFSPLFAYFERGVYLSFNESMGPFSNLSPCSESFASVLSSFSSQSPTRALEEE